MMKLDKEKIIFIGILLLGLFYRLLFIDKPTGFWHNEMVMYNQSIAGFPFGIIKAAVASDVHFPLYQLILAIWMKMFSHNDIVIRLFSVLMGVLTIVFAFMTGKEIKNEKLGNTFAFLVAINSVLIFYSQEVKFYIMLALLTAISLFAFSRIKNKNKISDYALYVIANAAMIYTFTIGILYVFAQSLVFLTYIFAKNRKLLKRFLIANSVLILTLLPFVYYMFVHLGKYEAAYWIFTSNIYTVWVLIQNYFSPFLIGIYNNPVVYIFTIGIMPILFVYIPVLIAFLGMFKAIKEDKNNLFILAIPVLFLVFETILCCHSGLRMLTRYTILAVVPLLLLVAIGLNSLKPKFLKATISYLLIVYTFFLIGSPQSAVRGYRDIGQKPIAMLLTQNKIKDSDTIVLALRKNDFDKYITFKGRKFSMLQDFVYKDYAFDSSKSDKYESFKKYVFDDGSINKGFEKYFKQTVLAPMKKGDRLYLIWDENYNLYPFKDVKNYRKYPVMTMSLSKTNFDTLRLCMKYLKTENGFQLKHYKLICFEKV